MRGVLNDVEFQEITVLGSFQFSTTVEWMRVDIRRLVERSKRGCNIIKHDLNALRIKLEYDTG